MKEITRDGVYYNLKISPYRYETENYIFHFSSRLGLTRFHKAVNFWIAEVNEKLEKRVKVGIRCIDLACFLLYEKIEGRGYYVLDRKAGEEVWLKQLELDGNLVKKKKSHEKSAVIMNVGGAQ